MLRVTALEPTERFKKDLRRLDGQTQGLVSDALKQLLLNPLPKSLRHHTLGGHRPTIHVIDVRGNHSHQVTFNMQGSVALLLRVGSHKQIDRDPG